METPTPLSKVINNNILSGWLMKLNTAVQPHRFDKRFVFIKDNFLIWNQTFVPINYSNRITVSEIKRYNGVVWLSLIKKIRTAHVINEITGDTTHELEIIVNPFNQESQQFKLIFQCCNTYQLNIWFLRLQHLISKNYQVKC